MVGVGGRSKACNNCRRRRVKCDETKPICNRCIKARLKCEGYPALTIIQYDGSKAEKGSQNGLENFSTMVPDAKPESTSKAQSVEFSFSFWISIPQDEMFTSYTLSRLLSARGEEAIVVTGIGHKLTEKCFLALSTTYFGVEHRETSLIQRGFHRYGYALKQLNQTLCDSTLVPSLDVVEAVTVMTLFEFLVSNDEHGWVSHARGLEKLFELRGPENFTSPLALLTLERARLSIIFAALVLHQSTIFAESCWKYIPWGLSLGRKTLLQYLLDILSDCPGLFAMKDEIDASASRLDAYSNYQPLLEKSQNLLNDLDEWERSWITQHPNCSYEIPSPTTTPVFTNSKGQKLTLWSTILHYQSRYHANTSTIYNATRILVLKFIRDLSRSEAECTTKEQYLSENMFQAGIMICRGVNYHLHDIREGAGSFFLLFPLRMAFDAIEPCNPEISAWIRTTLDCISSGSVSRWAAAKYILGLKSPKDGHVLYG